jgi:hypothetical protein
MNASARKYRAMQEIPYMINVMINLNVFMTKTIAKMKTQMIPITVMKSF